ncbi:hypothetical protein [Janthinobacterium sp.]|uniref:hypothetical protein n=1 Tax=Janthinobacterium sp. TaxID=1871054 RepID=UPI0025C256B0|nr:hypothetical protein [Janthinobacterium sp.]NBV20154.1 hypothetical protein [Janthinobacterium sp.]
MAVPEKTSQFRAAVGFTGLIVKNDPDGGDSSLLGGHIAHDGMIIPPGASTAAAGTTTADAGVLPAGTSSYYPTTAADGTKGVRVNAADKINGKVIFIGNGVAASALKVYAPSGGSINGAAADAAFVTSSGKGCVLICLSATSNTWAGF